MNRYLADRAGVSSPVPPLKQLKQSSVSKPMKRMALGMACASALAWCGPARSDEPSQEPAKLFESLDKNSDGTLTADEVGEDRKRFFERLVRVGDKNEDQKLSRDEFVASMTEQEKPVETPRSRSGGDRPMPSPGQMFDRFDRNRDGKLTKEEIPEQAPPEMRERLELVFTASLKSELTREDFEKTIAKYGRPGGPDGRRPEGNDDRPRPEGERDREMAREGDRRPGPDRDGDRPRGPEGDRTERGDRPEGREEMRSFGGSPFNGRRPASPLVRALDRNEDGKLSRNEIARIVDRFEELDRNSDGELDTAEIIGSPFGGGFSPFGGSGRPGFGGPEGMRREQGDRDREMAREGDRRPEAPRDGDKRPEGPRDGDRRPEGPRDGDRPRPEDARDGDRPRPEGRPEGRPVARPEGRPDMRPEGGPPRGERGAGAPRGGEGRGTDFFARLDKNSDGVISKEEAPERMQDRFKDLDGNGDGKINPEELREAIAKDLGVPSERRERRPEIE